MTTWQQVTSLKARSCWPYSLAPVVWCRMRLEAWSWEGVGERGTARLKTLGTGYKRGQQQGGAAYGNGRAPGARREVA